MRKIKVIYELYVSSGSPMETKMVFIGKREAAQDYVGDLIEVGNGRLDPLNFNLVEIVTVKGIIISQQSIDI